jgi:hypothetical protein
VRFEGTKVPKDGAVLTTVDLEWVYAHEQDIAHVEMVIRPTRPSLFDFFRYEVVGEEVEPPATE